MEIKQRQIRTVSISDLKPYENNPRKNDNAVNAVAESIKRFGFNQPIVIDRNGVIVAGHTRYKAAERLGMETVPCVYVDDLTEDEINAYRLADNKTAELSDWDFEMLSGEIQNISDIDMSEFGFLCDEGLKIDGSNLESTKSEEKYLKFANKKIPMSEEENQALLSAFDEYLEINKVAYGFVGALLWNT